MKLIALWHPKGGVGKTTIALNLAGCLTHQGKKVLVVDLDPQKSSLWISDLTDHKGLGFTVIDYYPDEKPDVDYIITDYPPRIEYLPSEAIILAPVKPVAHEVAALIAALKRVNSKKHNIIPFVNMFDPRRSEHADNVNSLPVLKESPRIHNRSVFERAINRGLHVFASEVWTLYGAAEARREIENLLKHTEA